MATKTNPRNRIDLTSAATERVKAPAGREAPVLELKVEELEQRTAPSSLLFHEPPDPC